jgi:hypothetical protein
MIQVIADELVLDHEISDLKEDVATLRHDNEALNDTLQRSTHAFDLMAQHLDGLRISNLFRALTGIIISRKHEAYLRVQLFRR